MRCDYNHVNQGGYDELCLNSDVSSSISKISHNFLDTILGLNLEKEWNNGTRRCRLFFRTGWHCQLWRNHSTATIHFSVPHLRDTYSPIFTNLARNSALLIAGCRKRFNDHWDITASWHGSFSKNCRYNSFCTSLGYIF
ncbi:MAG: autotransporter outer membrane beta-barrel domain-containing protein [Puniceicoccales bacterium]|nr:autotransporter outer membrane beta-barrel domain-containing protein [Puniceicoccales bacterium]